MRTEESLEDPSRAVDRFLDNLEGKSPSDRFVVCALTHTGQETLLHVGSFAETRAQLIRDIDKMMRELAGVTIQTYEDYSKTALEERGAKGATLH